jgi:hypothetical protein
MRKSCGCDCASGRERAVAGRATRAAWRVGLWRSAHLPEEAGNAAAVSAPRLHKSPVATAACGQVGLGGWGFCGDLPHADLRQGKSPVHAFSIGN